MNKTPLNEEVALLAPRGEAGTAGQEGLALVSIGEVVARMRSQYLFHNFAGANGGSGCANAGCASGGSACSGGSAVGGAASCGGGSSGGKYSVCPSCFAAERSLCVSRLWRRRRRRIIKIAQFHRAPAQQYIRGQDEPVVFPAVSVPAFAALVCASIIVGHAKRRRKEASVVSLSVWLPFRCRCLFVSPLTCILSSVSTCVVVLALCASPNGHSINVIM